MQVYNQAQDEENAALRSSKLAGFSATAGKHAAPKTARKAFANITNTARQGEQQQQQQQPGKQTPAAKLPASSRKGRALGDITNLAKPPLR